MKLFSMLFLRNKRRLKKLAETNRQAVVAHKQALKVMNQGKRKADEFKETLEANGITMIITEAIGGHKS